MRDTTGDRIGDKSFKHFRKQLKKQPDLRRYNEAVKEALAWAKFVGLKQSNVAAVSVFTTQSVTATLEKIRDQLKADTPAPADFRLGPGGTRTVFPLSNVTGITFNQQVGIAPTFSAPTVPLSALGVAPGTVGQLAFGKYLSPDYETAAKFIPPVGTLSGTPEVQGINEVFFNLFLPSGPQPPGGWPVAIFSHGSANNKNNAAFLVAATMATQGIATVVINAVGQGGGPLGTLTVNQTAGSPVTFPAGGCGTDQDGNGLIGSSEGINAAPPRTIIGSRDGVQQTVVDLMQLVREIEVGMDVDGDGVPDLDPSRIFHFGQSFGGNLGPVFLAVEPSLRVGVPNVPCGSGIECARLSPFQRPSVGLSLAARVPSLINVGGITFNENLPLRNQPPVINDVPGAMEIQEFFEHREWVTQFGNPAAYAPHLRKQPLAGVPAKAVIIQFAKGDQLAPNPTTTTILRTGNLADCTTFFRYDLAFAANPAVSKILFYPHTFLTEIFDPLVAGVALGAQQQIAEFFASDGALVIDPDWEGPLLEVPIIPPLPEELNFIP